MSKRAGPPSSPSSGNFSTLDREHLQKDLILLCREVGGYLRREGETFDRSRIEYKGFNNPVSYVDKTAEEKLVERLARLVPEAGFITEEGTENQRKDLNWIVDPLDGTGNFAHGLPLFAVSVALARGEQQEIGVVYEVNRDECFHAIKGQGAYCNDTRINVSPAAKLEDSLLATGFPYHDFDRAHVYLQIFDDFMRKTHGLRRMGSAAVDLAYVAMGRFEGFFEYNLNSWDVAAGALIVEEAGGVVTDFKGNPEYLFSGEVVAAGPVHGEMVETIVKYW